MRAILVAAAVVAAALPLDAQQPPAAAPHTAAGRVVKATEKNVLPIKGVWVTLHRIGPDSARPMDSVRTGADGAFRISYRPYGPAQSIYFVATMWAGIAYFSTPLRDPGLEQHAVLTVFDTTSAGAPLPVQGRHTVVFAPKPDGTREVAEVYEIANNDAKTRVAPGAGKPSWSAPIPASATDFRAGESDVSAGMIIGSAGKVEVFAPFAPGLKQIRFSYRLPRSAFPLTLAPLRDPAVLEVVMEEKGASASGGGLKATDPVPVDDRTFARWLAPNAPVGAVVTIKTGGSKGQRMPAAVMALVAALGVTMIIALIYGLRRRG